MATTKLRYPVKFALTTNVRRPNPVVSVMTRRTHARRSKSLTLLPYAFQARCNEVRHDGIFETAPQLVLMTST